MEKMHDRLRIVTHKNRVRKQGDEINGEGN